MSRVDELVQRIKAVVRYDWICRVHEAHTMCVNVPTEKAPRLIKEFLFCWCHNCEQTRRRTGSRRRWS